MSITQTVEVPDSHRLTIDVPREVPAGPVILTFTPASEQISADDDCPLCAKYRDPKTGALPYNAVTLAAMQEARDIADGKIPGTWYHSVEELRKELEI